jgi:hypothetical protein
LGERAESASAHVRDCVVREVEAAQETHPSEGVRVQAFDFVEGHVQHFQDRVSGEGSPEIGFAAAYLHNWRGKAASKGQKIKGKTIYNLKKSPILR